MSQHTTRRYLNSRWMKIPKVKFASWQDAELAVQRMVDGGVVAVLNVYQCGVCEWYHVGKAKTGVPRSKGFPKLTGNPARDRYNLLNTLYRRMRFYNQRRARGEV